MAIGIPWYSREEYPALRATFADADGLYDTFEQWLAHATRLEKLVKREGLPTLRVLIDHVQFPRWCKERGVPMDSKARSNYAAEQARRYFMANQSAS